MEYYKHKTAFDKCPEHIQKKYTDCLSLFAKDTLEIFKKKGCSGTELDAISCICLSESAWMLKNRKFFSLSNDVIEEFSTLNMDIKWDYFHCSHNPCIINLPIGNKLETIWEDDIYEAQNILFSILSDNYGIPFLSIIVFWGNKNHNCVCPFYMKLYPGEHNTIGKSVNCQIEKANKDGFIDENRKNYVDLQTIEKIIRITIATILFSHNTHIVPGQETLNEVFHKFSKKNKRRVNQEKRNRKNGTIDYNNTSFQLFYEHIKSISQNKQSHSELKYQHERTGYYAIRWIGIGKKEKKIVYIQSTIVRKDLPKRCMIA